jgi:hypothetical protein
MIRIYFEHHLIRCDKAGSITFDSPSGTVSKSYDLIIGAGDSKIQSLPYAHHITSVPLII